MRDGTRALRRLRRKPWHQSAGAVAAALALLGMCGASAQEPAPPQPCVMRLSLEVTPDVPNPSDGGFLSSLLGNHPGYQLSVRRVVDDTHVDLLLYGPGPTSNCQGVVDSMRNDGRVQSLDVRD